MKDIFKTKGKKYYEQNKFLPLSDKITPSSSIKSVNLISQALRFEKELNNNKYAM